MPSSRSRDCHQPVLCGAAGLAAAGVGRCGADEAACATAGRLACDAGGAAGSFQPAAWKGWCELVLARLDHRLAASARRARRARSRAWWPRSCTAGSWRRRDASQWMNTPTEMNRSSASSCGDGALGDAVRRRPWRRARWAGPNICTACLASLIVTLLNMTVAGLTIRFGSSTARRPLTPSFWLVSVIANAVSAARAARADDEIDMRHLVAVADERLADEHPVNLRHRCLPVRKSIGVRGLIHASVAIRSNGRPGVSSASTGTARPVRRSQAGRRRDRHATVRSAVVPGLSPRAFRSASSSSRSRSQDAGSPAASSALAPAARARAAQRHGRLRSVLARDVAVGDGRQQRHEQRRSSAQARPAAARAAPAAAAAPTPEHVLRTRGRSSRRCGRARRPAPWPRAG